MSSAECHHILKDNLLGRDWATGTQIDVRWRMLLQWNENREKILFQHENREKTLFQHLPNLDPAVSFLL